MSNEPKKKRKWGDRRDGRRVKAPGLQTVMCYLWPYRTDCEVFLYDNIDATDLLRYLEKRNAELILQKLQSVAHRRLRHKEILRRLRDVLRLDQHQKGLHIHLIHALPPS